MNSDALQPRGNAKSGTLHNDCKAWSTLVDALRMMWHTGSASEATSPS